MKLYLLENYIFYDFGCSGMSGTLTKLTNIFVHDYKLPHHQFFPPPSTYTPIPATVSPNLTTTTTKNSRNSTTSTTTTTTTTSNPGTTTGNSIMAQTTRVASFGPLGEFFFFLRVFFLSLNNIYSNYDYIKATEGLREGGDEENGPTRRESRRLGH